MPDKSSHINITLERKTHSLQVQRPHALAKTFECKVRYYIGSRLIIVEHYSSLSARQFFEAILNKSFYMDGEVIDWRKLYYSSLTTGPQLD